MVLTGSGVSAVFSSSCMPFLKALMPCATSPIKSEILPRPNNSRTTAITTIQCQMLSEPILQPSKQLRPAMRPLFARERRRRRCQKQGLKPRHIGDRGDPLSLLLTAPAANPDLTAAVFFRLHSGRKRQFQIADFKGILVIAQRRIVRRRGNAEARWQPRVQQSRPFQLFETRQIAERLEAELRQESFGGTEG